MSFGSLDHSAWNHQKAKSLRCHFILRNKGSIRGLILLGTSLYINSSGLCPDILLHGRYSINWKITPREWLRWHCELLSASLEVYFPLGWCRVFPTLRALTLSNQSAWGTLNTIG